MAKYVTILNNGVKERFDLETYAPVSDDDAAYQTVAGMTAYQTVSGMSAYETVAGMAVYQRSINAAGIAYVNPFNVTASGVGVAFNALLSAVINAGA
jgi:hypothetical protein